MSKPGICDARKLAKRDDMDVVIVFHIDAEGQMGYASYGKDRETCQAARVLADRMFDEANGFIDKISPRLPDHLLPFVRRAAADALPDSSVRLSSGGMVTQPNSFVRAWALAYLTGDQTVALEKLELVYAAMKKEPTRKIPLKIPFGADGLPDMDQLIHICHDCYSPADGERGEFSGFRPQQPCERCGERIHAGYIIAKPEPERKAGHIDIPAGTAKKSCSSCGADIYWIITAAGKKMPVDPDGVSHFATCPQSKRWSGSSRAEVRA